MKKTLVFLVKATLTLVILVLLITWVGWSNVKTYLLETPSPRTLLPALLLAVLFNLVKIAKWRSMVRRTGHAMDFKAASGSYLVGMAGGLFTPGRVGEVSRMVYLPVYSRAYVAAMTLLDRLFDILAVVLLALPGLAFFTAPALFWFILTACVAALVSLFLPLTLPARLLGWIRQRIRSNRLSGLLENCEKAVLALPRTGMVLWVLQSLLGYLIVLVEFHWLLNGLSPTSISAVIHCQPLIMLTNILPFTLAGIGVREGAAAVLLGSFAVPPAAAVSAAFQLFLLNTALPGLVGALWLVFFRPPSRPI